MTLGIHLDFLNSRVESMVLNLDSQSYKQWKSIKDSNELTGWNFFFFFYFQSIEKKKGSTAWIWRSMLYDKKP